jgi:hypothetical protein
LLQEHPTEAPPCVSRIDEECSDLGAIGLWIQPGIIAVAVRIAAEERSTPTPTAAADDVVGI